MKLLTIVFTVVAVGFGTGSADAATVVALGASNTRGKGLAITQAYPAPGLRRSYERAESGRQS